MDRLIRNDVLVVKHGSIFRFVLLTDAARQWVEENVTDEHTMMGNALIVEHRYARDLADGMMKDGLKCE